MPRSHSEPTPAAAAQQAKAPELRGAEILVRSLQAEGVKYIWGYPGGSVLHIYDALYKQKELQHILVRHEQAAVHAADGYARATGDVGVALVTSGPGATNAITGIATAYMDSVPLVVLTGQVPCADIGLDAFQECDTVGISRHAVKHNFLVKDVRDLALTVKKAFHIARTGRPGPVVVDLPKDVTFNRAPWTGYPETVRMRSYNPVRKGHSGQIRKALGLLLEAKRPYIYVGGGVISAGACEQLRELAALTGFPVASSLMGLGAFPASDRQFLGLEGMHGTFEANCAMYESDVLLNVGARFSDRSIGNVRHFMGRERQIIHIDVDPSSIAKRVRADIPIVGDAKQVLTDLIAAWREAARRPDEAALAEWWQRIEQWRSKQSLSYEQGGDIIKPQFVIETLSRITQGEDVYITSDVGQHQMWAAQLYKFEQPRRWINSGGLGTMGVGLPYAMGVKRGRPDSDVFCVTSEGSIQMCIQELATCQQYGTPVKIVALNNSYLGMVRQWQELQYDRRYSHTPMEAVPDFVKLAEAYGHVGMRIEKPADVEPALREARAIKDRTVFMDFRTDSSENVFPMVMPGAGITEMLLRPGSESKA